MKPIYYLLLLYVLLLSGYVFSSGFFTFQGFVMVFIVFILLLKYYLIDLKKNIKSSFSFKDLTLILTIILIFQIVIGSYTNKIIYARDLLSNNLIIIFLLLSIMLSISLLLVRTIKTKTKLYVYLIIVAVISRFLVVIASPEPAIDVFYILKEAPFHLIQGENPYSVNYTKIYEDYKSDYFAYWPGSFLIVAPFSLLLKDPRYAFILSELLAVYLFIKMNKNKEIGFLLSLLFLYHPLSLFILEQSWINPLNFLITLFILFLIYTKKANEILLGVLLGILTSIQFYHVLLVPIFMKIFKNNIKLLSGYFFVLAAVVLPFFIISPKDFIYDTILTWTIKPPVVPIPYHLSLNIKGFFLNIANSEIPNIFLLAIFLIIYLWLFKSLKNTISSLAWCVILSLFSFFMLGTQAFANYYYTISSLLLTSISFIWLTSSNYVTKKQ